MIWYLSGLTCTHENAMVKAGAQKWAAEAGVARAVAEKRAELWVAQNQKAFECWNAYVEKNGLPLGKYRSF